MDDTSDINTMLCPIKVNSYTIEFTVHTSCYCVSDLLCVTWMNALNGLDFGSLNITVWF